MKKTAEIISLIASQKEFLLERFGIAKMVLYGSYAKGLANEVSDIDLMYELTEGGNMTLARLSNMEKYFKELLSISKVELVRKKYMEPIIFDAVKREGIEIF
ncbi:MAG: nucleotidyltransferase domain-containing protein [Chitinophagaceae bacterium]|nr:nucleotidyltransferase domain-containing protein [Chitinophagaceae bacterium]